MYIVKVDLIDQVVRFLLLLVLHQLTLQVQVFINLSSLHLLPLPQLPTFQLLIISSLHLLSAPSKWSQNHSLSSFQCDSDKTQALSKPRVSHKTILVKGQYSLLMEAFMGWNYRPYIWRGFAEWHGSSKIARESFLNLKQVCSFPSYDIFCSQLSSRCILSLNAFPASFTDNNNNNIHNGYNNNNNNHHNDNNNRDNNNNDNNENNNDNNNNKKI